eukprot:3132310-Alexandrium_andersonii.AAC.1
MQSQRTVGHTHATQTTCKTDTLSMQMANGVVPCGSADGPRLMRSGRRNEEQGVITMGGGAGLW